MTDYIILLVGKSGTGKSAVAEELERKHGLTQLRSYTTRKPRFEDEDGHIFVSEPEFDALSHVVAYTEYHGARYCATAAQADASDVYIIDPAGVDSFDERYTGFKRPIIIYLVASRKTRKERMAARGDSLKVIRARLKYDRKAFRTFQQKAFDQTADIIPIDTDDRTPEQLADKIFNIAETIQRFRRDETSDR